MLYLVATPIGNLADMSYRAVEVLKKSDYILCEDTRTSLVLLKHYDIHKPLKSYHKFNETHRENEILEDLKKGLTIALITDAGTPGISDPGSALITACRKENLPVSAIPGPCAALLALTLSGFSTERFQAVGFLPKKSSELKTLFLDLLEYSGTTICYESPHRILKTLQLLSEIASERPLCILRELTKLYEEHLQGTAAELLAHFEKHPPRGELVLLISSKQNSIDYTSLSPQEHVAQLQNEYGLSKQEAIKLCARLRNVPKREIYSSTIE